MKIKSLLNSITLLMLLVSCGGYNDGPSIGSQDNLQEGQTQKLDMKAAKRKLLFFTTTNVIAPSYEILKNDAKQLEATINSYCVALDTNKNIKQSEENVVTQWKKTTDSIHFLESFMIGPIKGYLEEIYSREMINPCGIDTELIKANRNKKYKGPRQVSKKGITAIEYLMYDKTIKSSCIADIPMVKEWEKKDNLSKKKDRCHYLKFVAKDLVKHTNTYNNTWSKDGENYPHQLLNKNILGSVDATINALTDAVFFLEVVTKDKKIGIPTGINDNECEWGFCPHQSEHIFSNYSFSSLIKNLEGTRAILTGTNPLTGQKGFGFNSYLASIEHKFVGDLMIHKIDKAIKNLKSQPVGTSVHTLTLNLDIPSCKRSSSTNREQEACALYYDIKQVTDVLKTEFLVAMQVAAPRDAQGDQD